MTLHIVDQSGTTVFDLPQQFGSEQFDADRTLEYKFDVPIDRLSPGQYLLAVEARSGSDSARRNLRFRRR